MVFVKLLAYAVVISQYISDNLDYKYANSGIATASTMNLGS